MSLINACVNEMNTFINNGGITQGEEEYYSRVGEAPVDKVFHMVSARMFDNSVVDPMPSGLHRTCTGYFGLRCTPEEVAFKEWEA